MPFWTGQKNIKNIKSSKCSLDPLSGLFKASRQSSSRGVLDEPAPALQPRLTRRRGRNRFCAESSPQKSASCLWAVVLLVLMWMAFVSLFKTHHYNHPFKSISSFLLCLHKSLLHFSPLRPRRLLLSIAITFIHRIGHYPLVERLILYLKEHIKMAQSIYDSRSTLN